MKKGNYQHFGMKAHIDVDANSALVHMAPKAAASAHDVTQAGTLLHGQKTHVLPTLAAGTCTCARRCLKPIQTLLGRRP